jgi:uncharacterized repeat protein (TIGR03847 family)
MTAFDLDAPDHFTTGAVGPPGQRVFYLQARQRRRVVTLKAEKEQMRALAEYLADLLAKLPESGETVPPDVELLEPIEAAWTIGSIGLGWDEERERVIIVVHEAVEGEDEGQEEAEAAETAATERAASTEDGATARFAVTRAQAAAFVARTEKLMKAGRPICPMCSQPKDPAGHVCPRSNGHIVHS